jgi:hypothetical protein
VWGVIGHELRPVYQGLAGLFLAALLLEAGLRRLPEYRYQSYVAGTFAGTATLSLFVISPISTTVTDAWVVLPAAAVLAYTFAWRISREPGFLRAAEFRPVASLSACLGTALVLVLEWRILDVAALGAAWAVTAAALLATGTWTAARGLRWQAFAIFGCAAIACFQVLAGPAPASAPDIAWMLFTIAVLYAGTVVSRRPTGARTSEASSWEESCRVVLSVTSTFLLTVLVLDQVRPTLLTLAWGVEGAALFAAGFAVRERPLRLAGLTLLLICVAKLFVFDLGELEAIARIVSFVVLGLVLLAVSWTYTRFRDQFRRFL